MKSLKVTFNNNEESVLAARLELPLNSHPIAYAIFAHCFTCNKNFTAVRNISRALTQQGIAVLRFDFTGLGESEGDFADTNFSSNIDDLMAAINFVKENYGIPRILIGHSLGGAAVIRAASKSPDIKAVATIGAPAHPEHVQHLFKDNLDAIAANGKARVFIGGREFTVKKSFIDDLQQQQNDEVVKQLRRALLIMHSPQDMVVGIENAAILYKEAHHPKSFVTLDGADHLLTNKQDSLYAGTMIANWVMRYIDVPEQAPLTTNKQVVARIGNDDYTTAIKAGKHQLLADEPEEVGGNDFGPTPYDLLTAGLGACTAMTLRMYADRKQWDLKGVTVHLEHGKKYREDCEDCEQPHRKIDHFEREIILEGDLDDKQKQRLLEIADKCPVHKTLHAEVAVVTTLKE